MPKMSSIENIVVFELDLINNEHLDIESTRNDFENWIPFSMLLKIEDEVYKYTEKDTATFTVYEIRNLISRFESIVESKVKGLTIESYEFVSSENFFEIAVSDPLEKDQLSVEIWINMGTYTNGDTYGYDKGFRFDVPLVSFESFTIDLRIQVDKFVTQ